MTIFYVLATCFVVILIIVTCCTLLNRQYALQQSVTANGAGIDKILSIEYEKTVSAVLAASEDEGVIESPIPCAYCASSDEECASSDERYFKCLVGLKLRR